MHLGIEVSAVVGDAVEHGKAAALQELGAEVYVGDHLGDITGARAADALAVGVATGPISAEDLAAAGADVVLADLTRFPAVAGVVPRWRRCTDAPVPGAPDVRVAAPARATTSPTRLPSESRMKAWRLDVTGRRTRPRCR